MIVNHTKISFYFAFFFTLGSILPGIAQNFNRQFEHAAQKGNVLTVNTNDGYYRFEIYNPFVIETSFIPKGKIYNPNSYAVIGEPQSTPIHYTAKQNQITFSSSGIAVHLQKQPFKVSYTFNGHYLISEKAGYRAVDSTEQLEFNLTQTEILLGGGARALGMNRRGHRLKLYNRAHYAYKTHSELLNFTLPIVLSSRKYMIHFDNPQIGYLDLDSQNDNTLTYESIGGPSTYQIIAAKGWKTILDRYTDLTGKQPLPPRWAFGNFASRFGYHSQEEVLNTIKKYREDQIPLDVVILDLYWYGHSVKGHMGNLAFVRDSFPKPKKMIKTLRNEGVKTVLITQPFVLTTSNRWNEAVKKGVLATDSLGNPATYDFFFGHTGLIDIFKPEARDWFWNIYRNLVNMGIAGFWGDLGEPEVHPSWVQHVNGSADEVHNIYGNAWAKLIYNGFQTDFPKKRPFILMRAGYAGAQRFGMIPWSGDVSRSWGGLYSQPEISLEMGMQGIAYMHSDLGGFAGAYNDNELYQRWLQYGVFQPIYRPHGQEEVASEPVFKTPKTEAIVKKAIELRYRLLPYNYSLAFINHTKGWPLMRPLFFETPNTLKSYLVSDPYYWGKNFLISPIRQKGITHKRIHFPKTANWFDFYTGKRYKAGSTHNITLHENHIPTFVKGGAFIPMIDVIQTTDDYSIENLTIHFYNDNAQPESSGLVYNDDGITPKAYENGAYEILHLHSQQRDNGLIIQLSKEIGTHYESSIETLHFVLHNIPKAPQKISSNGETITATYHADTRVLTFSIAYKSADSKSIHLLY